jgi:S-DNA-T family DNA segregation ATPase FtsK/SpoIIIE
MARSKQSAARGDVRGEGKVFGTPISTDTRSGLGVYLVWFLQVGIWCFLLAAVWSFDNGDWPSSSVFPHNDPARNLCGVAGSVVSYGLLRLLGAGVWVLMGLWALYLAVDGLIARVTHPLVRLLGAVLMAVAVAGLQAHWAPQWSQIVNVGGGAVGTVFTGYLYESVRPLLGSVGVSLVLLMVLGVGAVVALDVWVIIAPRWAARQLAKAAPPVAAVTGAAASATASGTMTIGKRVMAAVQGLIHRGDEPVVKGKRKRAKSVGADEAEAQAVLDAAEGAELKPKKRGKKGEAPTETIDENAGGLGATEAFDPAAAVQPAATEGEDAEAEAEDEAADQEQAEEGKKAWTPEELRAKIAKLPLKIAGETKKAASESDLRDIQSMGEMEGYKFPGLDQLEEPEANFNQTMEAYVREQATALERALKEYRIDGEVVGIQSGPVITNYEIRLAPGTKVSALTGVSSDLARSLKAVNVRIVSNTAGRDTVGVEVPNTHKEKVRLKELMGKSGVYNGMTLPMFLGKDASGEPLIQDLAKMPHMLIAGTTGSGKSVCMSSILMSFLYTKKPNELKLVLVDPKMVELSQFKDIPHLMCPVVTEMGKAAAILEWAVRKMDERYELLAEAGVNNIGAYNALSWDELKERFNPADEGEAARIPKKLPYMVFVIDELADLMMTNKEVETSIIRLAQKARAVGMHLILATQRPQANVVTGLIKSNMPSRIAFKVSSGMDSRIVMDQKGAELLLGQGDMLFLSPRSSELTRAQGTLVDDKEIRRVVKFLKEIAQPSFERSLMQIKTGAAAAGELEGDDGEVDPNAVHNGYAVAQQDDLFEKAVDVVIETGVGSVSMLQRRLAIGYTRAARLVELMGHVGILGAHKGTQARELTMGPQEWAAMKAQMAADREAGTVGGKPADQSGARRAPAGSINDALAGADEDQGEEGDEDDAPFEADEPASARR